eukprot:TRINITY_DN22571_c0_g1_i1.p1 TRINITY_DN22571_c0_g1~~TRINITY_DN22571_c0_g1_i1.p1  ORF type:complete len:942 (+),score=151.50 TRINITY_DN22571_c0_g1_i1:132-2957(+)
MRTGSPGSSSAQRSPVSSQQDPRAAAARILSQCAEFTDARGRRECPVRPLVRRFPLRRNPPGPWGIYVNRHCLLTRVEPGSPAALAGLERLVPLQAQLLRVNGREPTHGQTVGECLAGAMSLVLDFNVATRATAQTPPRSADRRSASPPRSAGQPARDRFPEPGHSPQHSQGVLETPRRPTGYAASVTESVISSSSPPARPEHTENVRYTVEQQVPWGVTLDGSLRLVKVEPQSPAANAGLGKHIGMQVLKVRVGDKVATTKAEADRLLDDRVPCEIEFHAVAGGVWNPYVASVHYMTKGRWEDSAAPLGEYPLELRDPPASAGCGPPRDHPFWQTAHTRVALAPAPRALPSMLGSESDLLDLSERQRGVPCCGPLAAACASLLVELKEAQARLILLQRQPAAPDCSALEHQLAELRSSLEAEQRRRQVAEDASEELRSEVRRLRGELARQPAPAPRSPELGEEAVRTALTEGDGRRAREAHEAAERGSLRERAALVPQEAMRRSSISREERAEVDGIATYVVCSRYLLSDTLDEEQRGREQLREHERNVRRELAERAAVVPSPSIPPALASAVTELLLRQADGRGSIEGEERLAWYFILEDWIARETPGSLGITLKNIKGGQQGAIVKDVIRGGPSATCRLRRVAGSAVRRPGVPAPVEGVHPSPGLQRDDRIVGLRVLGERADVRIPIHTELDFGKAVTPQNHVYAGDTVELDIERGAASLVAVVQLCRNTNLILNRLRNHVSSAGWDSAYFRAEVAEAVLSTPAHRQAEEQQFWKEAKPYFCEDGTNPDDEVFTPAELAQRFTRFLRESVHVPHGFLEDAKVDVYQRLATTLNEDRVRVYRSPGDGRYFFGTKAFQQHLRSIGARCSAEQQEGEWMEIEQAEKFSFSQAYVWLKRLFLEALYWHLDPATEDQPRSPLRESGSTTRYSVSRSHSTAGPA